jgi:hypothetical protein
MRYTASSFVRPLTAQFHLFVRSYEAVVPPQGYFPYGASYASDSGDPWLRLFGLINRKGLYRGTARSAAVAAVLGRAEMSRRGAVFADVTSWAFKLGLVLNLAALFGAVLMMPLGFPATLSSRPRLFAVGRFATVLATLDTGSSFGRMGQAARSIPDAVTQVTL